MSIEPAVISWSGIVRRIIVVGLLVVLPLLAQASPPDPSWIAGWWDNADYDDVVTLVLATGTAVTPTPVIDSCPEPLVLPLPSPTHVTRRALVSKARLRIRPPPAV
jgi:hypothetical protein